MTYVITFIGLVAMCNILYYLTLGVIAVAAEYLADRIKRYGEKAAVRIIIKFGLILSVVVSLVVMML